MSLLVAKNLAQIMLTDIFYRVFLYFNLFNERG